MINQGQNSWILGWETFKESTSTTKVVLITLWETILEPEMNWALSTAERTFMALLFLVGALTSHCTTCENTQLHFFLQPAVSTWEGKLLTSLWLLERSFQPFPNSSEKTENGDSNRHMQVHFPQNLGCDTLNLWWAVILPAQPSPAELLFGVGSTSCTLLYTRTASTAPVLLPKREQHFGEHVLEK